MEVSHVHVNCSDKSIKLCESQKSQNAQNAVPARNALNGPCQILPSDDMFTTEQNGRVKIHMECTGVGATPPVSIPGLLMRIAANYPDVIALADKDECGDWKKWTYREYLQEVRTIAKAFLKLGLEKHHTVCILGFNSSEWFFSELGAIFAGGIACGIYTTNSPAACQHCADHSRANIIVVDDAQQLEKIMTIKNNLPHLKAIVLMKGETDQPGVHTWKQLKEIGENETEDQLENVLKTIAINEVAVIVFTSGTVGNPKAVMLSHDNLTFDALSVATAIGIEPAEEVLVSYLPLSHVAAQVIDIFIGMHVAATIYFADKMAFRGTLNKTLVEVQPTRFVGVPRVWEKIYEKMQDIGAQNGAVKKKLADWAKAEGLKQNLERFDGNQTTSLSYWLASMLVFRRVKAALGFSRCKMYISAAAPISKDIKQYFMSLDIPVVEAFGMSESACHTIGHPEHCNLDTIGATLPGVQTITINPDCDGNGELCMAGRNIFMGYLKDPEKTTEAIDADRFLRSGDVGKVDHEGFVYITGRIKELIITAGGENIAPVPVEHLVIAELPHLSNVMLVGEQKKFLSILVTLKTEIDPETNAPLDTLTSPVQTWVKSLGCMATTVKEVLEAGPHPKVLEAIQEGITRANKHAISNAQRIQKFVILPADFSVNTGELGPTLKMKRNIVAQKYKDIIDALYES